MSLRAELILRLSSPPPLQLSENFASYACVAAILRGNHWDNLELAYIRRATREQDRWSGQIAFPGGKAEPQDTSDLDTAIRETQEEIGITLSKNDLVGSLDDIQARKAGQLLEFFIRTFVFHIEEEAVFTLAPEEVADFFWIPLKNLSDPQNHRQFEFTRENQKVNLPAIQMPSEPPLWGLTYMMTQNLIQKISNKK